MSLPPTADVIVLSSTSTVPLHERFTIMLKRGPDQVGVEANLQQETSFSNRKLALQMEDRPSVLVALQHKSLKHSLRKNGVLARLGQPMRAISWRGAGRRFSIRELSDLSREGCRCRRVRGGAFKPGFNFRSLGPRRGWNSLARKKLRSALRMQGGLVTSSGQLVTHRAWYQTGRGRRGVGFGLDQAGTRGQSGFDSSVGFRDWGSFNNRGGFNTRGSYGTRGGFGNRGGSLIRGSFRARVAFGARGCGTFRGPLVITKEQLDNELDEYMSMSKSNLDAQLDEYMSMASADYIE